ncbi:hypothetical protein [Bradyrhizobium sp. USDA 4506]
MFRVTPNIHANVDDETAFSTIISLANADVTARNRGRTIDSGKTCLPDGPRYWVLATVSLARLATEQAPSGRRVAAISDSVIRLFRRASRHQAGARMITVDQSGTFAG